jgi:MFS family permease
MNWLINVVESIWAAFYVPVEHFWHSIFTIVGLLVILVAYCVLSGFANDFKKSIKRLEEVRRKESLLFNDDIRIAEKDMKKAHEVMIETGFTIFGLMCAFGLLQIVLQGHIVPILFIILAVIILFFTIRALSYTGKALLNVLSNVVFAFSNIKLKQK